MTVNEIQLSLWIVVWFVMWLIEHLLRKECKEIMIMYREMFFDLKEKTNS